MCCVSNSRLDVLHIYNHRCRWLLYPPNQHSNSIIKATTPFNRLKKKKKKSLIDHCHVFTHPKLKCTNRVINIIQYSAWLSCCGSWLLNEETSDLSDFSCKFHRRSAPRVRICWELTLAWRVCQYPGRATHRRVNAIFFFFTTKRDFPFKPHTPPTGL